MKILVLNGSPKGKGSNTLKIANSFLEGLNEVEDNWVEIVNIKDKDISHCLGCFNCWTKTPGKCVINDDMHELMSKYIEADLVVWSFPLYYYGMPSKIKAFLDRMLPTNLPFMVKDESGGSGHPPRYDVSHQRYILISTCGFHTIKNNYEALFKQFEIQFGDNLTRIICPEGELLKTPQLQGRINQYLTHVKQAGIEYAKDSKVSENTKAKLSELLYPADVYMEMADASWEINEPSKNVNSSDKSKKFMRQMSAVYNPSAWQGKNIIIEIYFTDINKTYQLCLGKEKCILKTDDFTEYTTRIETAFTLWQEISNGKVNGAKAMMDKQYKVLGDFETILRMGEYFGTKEISNKDTETKIRNNKEMKTNMNILLIPWILLWVLLPINPIIGGVCGIAIASIIPMLSYRFKLTLYDKLSISCVSIIGILSIVEYHIAIIICVSYVVFALMWILSALFETPLTAYYSCNDYKGEKALANPLFIKTNRILTILWGILYLVVASYSYFLINSSLRNYIGIINSIAPVLMGVFTMWFSRWYPAKVARG